jgi:hypothetical protein
LAYRRLFAPKNHPSIRLSATQDDFSATGNNLAYLAESGLNTQAIATEDFSRCLPGTDLMTG